MGSWTFITNHGAVLWVIAGQHRVTAREIARRLGITERSVHRIIRDLEAGGYLVRHRSTRGNYYAVDGARPLRRDGYREVAVGELLQALRRPRPQRPTRMRVVRQAPLGR